MQALRQSGTTYGAGLALLRHREQKVLTARKDECTTRELLEGALAIPTSTTGVRGVVVPGEPVSQAVHDPPAPHGKPHSSGGKSSSASGGRQRPAKGALIGGRVQASTGARQGKWDLVTELSGG